jgi:peptide methionine sulfoxide reductase msrA/msrB
MRMKKIGLILCLLLLLLAAVKVMMTKSHKDPFAQVELQYQDLTNDPELLFATFAGGCFWCMEGPFEQMAGVREVISGFAGGEVTNPTYEQVVAGGTGHRESVQVFYDPNQVSYQELVRTYWQQIDPTDAGGQFADRGEHYTTAIFYKTDAEKLEAEKQIEELNQSGRYEKPIVTQVLVYKNFFPAEEYHQDFYKKSAQYYQRYKKGSGREDYIEAAKKYWEEN